MSTEIIENADYLPDTAMETEMNPNYFVPTADEEYSFNQERDLDYQTTFCKKQYVDGYRSIMRNENGNQTRLEYYVTKNISGFHIRNALTGSIYPQYMVGSKMEYLFYKVRVSTEQSYKANTMTYQNKKHSNPVVILHKEDPDVLFYDSPEDFEKHQGVILKPEEKNKWRERYNSLLSYLAKVEQSRIEKQKYAQNAKVMVQ